MVVGDGASLAASSRDSRCRKHSPYLGNVMGEALKTKLVKRLSDKDSLIGKRGYSKANSEADTAEKRRYPKGYAKLKTEEKALGKHEVMGKLTGKGRRTVAVERKFAPEAKEIAFHDAVERKKLKNRK